MTDVPIIYSGPMVRALNADRKTNTRRMLYTERKYRVGVPGSVAMTGLETYPPPSSFTMGKAWVLTGWHKVKPGDRLWVRENWKPHSLYAAARPRDIPRSQVFYMADQAYAPSNTPWVPCIHMPRWASRLTLIVTGTKIERLNDISEDDARAEGCPLDQDGNSYDPPPAHADHRQDYARFSFRSLWSGLHGAASWDANPWVVALAFHVIKANIDAPEARVAA